MISDVLNGLNIQNEEGWDVILVHVWLCLHTSSTLFDWE